MMSALPLVCVSVGALPPPHVIAGLAVHVVGWSVPDEGWMNTSV